MNQVLSSLSRIRIQRSSIQNKSHRLCYVIESIRHGLSRFNQPLFLLSAETCPDEDWRHSRVDAALDVGDAVADEVAGFAVELERFDGAIDKHRRGFGI